MAGETALNWVGKHRDYLSEVSDTIWDYAEVGFQEFKSSKLLADELEKAGFTVERAVAGLPTAFVATWGSGSPRLGFLAEYDALPGLSQKVTTHREPVKEGAPGHGCGHNIFGAGVMGAVIALKEEMKEDKLPGTIVFYGCPAEELLAGKVFMARAGLFDDLDCALTWHPMGFNMVSLGSMTAMNSVKFTFHGIPAHAAASPEQGRSALDAVELMDIGANYLREHVVQEARIHYVITNGGGEPNVVPPEAQVWYYVRAPKRKDVDAIFERLVKIADGAAMMTDTTYDMKFSTACYDVLPNKALATLLNDSMKKIGAPTWNEDEVTFAKELTETFPKGAKEGLFRTMGIPDEYMGKYLDDTIYGMAGEGTVQPASSDVGDVSYVTPLAQFTTCCQALGSPGHSWQNVAAGGSSIAHKGLELAAKTLALSGSELLRNPEFIKDAREEFQKRTGGQPYKCALPPDVKPPLGELPEQ